MVGRNIQCFIGVMIFFTQVGCAKFMANLRRDLDDTDPYNTPTVGGVWPEGDLLQENNEYAKVGHSERNPASTSFTDNTDRSSWMTEENRDRATRDFYRDRYASGEPTFKTGQNITPAIKRQYVASNRMTKSDFVDRENENSLWSTDGQANFFFSKNKIRDQGDILTVVVGEELHRDVGIELKKTLSEDEYERALESTQKKLAEKALAGGAKKSGSSTKDKKESEDPEIEIPEATFADIDLTPDMGLKTGDTILAEIVERFPNGSYRIQGTKFVPYKGMQRRLSMVAIVRPSDVADDEKVESSKLYQYQLKMLR